MDPEKALRRREAMLKRIDRELKFGIPLPESVGCPNAAYGQHGDPNWRGRCPYCDKKLSKKPRLRKVKLINKNVFELPKNSRVRKRIEDERTFGEESDE